MLHSWRPLILLVAMILAVIISSCGASGDQTAFFGDQQPISRPDTPEQYSSFVNPYPGDKEAISAGKVLYEANCSSCHGLSGAGDGPASGGINPPPGNLAARQESLSDGYLYWRISEGGLMEPFNSIMPGWKGILDEEKIWQIISYLRTMVVL